MIVAETEGRYRFVTQPNHADLAGQLADRWGNDGFDRPEPHAPVMVAAYDHDDGWWEYDRRPHLGDDGTPVDFREMPADTWTDLYDRGIDGVVDLDPYAGLLVSMHGAGLRRRRYGLSPSWPDTQPAFSGFVEREEGRQRRLAAELGEGAGADEYPDVDEGFLEALHESGSAPDGEGGRLWFHYRLLQAWDTLSLAFCTTASPPGYGEIGPVPTAPGGPEETLHIDAVEDSTVVVEPYPFDDSPVSVHVPARSVPGDAFDGDRELLLSYYDAPPELLSFSLRRREG